MTSNTLFQSDMDDNWYFWLGGQLQGPYNDYVEGHEELTRILEEQREAKRAE